MNNRLVSRTSLRCTVLLMYSMWVQAGALHADALRAPVTEPLQQIGSGQLRWFGFHVYDASTWALQTSLPGDGSVPTPFALQITYARAITARELVQATRTAWADLGLLDSQAKSWLPQLERFWPDVKAGDSLVLLIDQQQQAQFFHNGAALGMFADIEFARRFVAIWLHPNSSEPELRQQLLGHAPS